MRLVRSVLRLCCCFGRYKTVVVVPSVYEQGALFAHSVVLSSLCSQALTAGRRLGL